MADFHKMQAKLPSGQWVTEVIPAGNIPDAKETMRARYPNAKTIQWGGTAPDPNYQQQVDQFRADTERKTQEYYQRAHGHVPGGREIPNCPVDENYQPSSRGSYDPGLDFNGGCAAVAVIAGGLVAISVVGAVVNVVSAPFRWLAGEGDRSEAVQSAPERRQAPAVTVPTFDRDYAIERHNYYVTNGINQRNCARNLTTTECAGQYRPEVFGLW